MPLICIPQPRMITRIERHLPAGFPVRVVVTPGEQTGVVGK
jgi:hypothetical protein